MNLDNKLKQRILGVALVTLVLMVVLPELIKSPPPQINETTVQVPLPQRPDVTLPDPQQTLHLDGTGIANTNATDTGSSETLTTASTTTPVEAMQTAPQTVIFSGPSVSAESAATPLLPGQQPLPSVTPAPELNATTAADVDLAAKVEQTTATEPTESTEPMLADSTETDQTTELALVTEPSASENSAAKDPTAPKVAIKLMSLERGRSKPNAAASPEPRKKSRSERQWVIQAGAFAVSKNANLLLDQLLAKQFPASLTPAQIDGRTLYLVQVGPYPSRDESRAVQQRLLREAELKGEVRLY